MVTQEHLKDRLHYDPDTGVFTWAKTLGPRAAAGEEAGSVSNRGYPQIRIGGKLYLSHKLAFLYMTGEVPERCDHINRVKHDNRWSNLRPCTQSQNLANSSMRSDNKSGYKGVCWCDREKRWSAQIGVGGKKNHLGYFTEAEEAYQVYVEAARRIYGDFSSV